MSQHLVILRLTLICAPLYRKWFDHHRRHLHLARKCGWWEPWFFFIEIMGAMISEPNLGVGIACSSHFRVDDRSIRIEYIPVYVRHHQSGLRPWGVLLQIGQHNVGFTLFLTSSLPFSDHQQTLTRCRRDFRCQASLSVASMQIPIQPKLTWHAYSRKNTFFTDKRPEACPFNHHAKQVWSCSII